MPIVKRLHSKEEFARRGDSIYENDIRRIRRHLKREDEGKFAAIDIESAAYEVGPGADRDGFTLWFVSIPWVGLRRNFPEDFLPVPEYYRA